MNNPDQIVDKFLKLLKENGQYSLLPQIVEKLQEEVWRNQEISVITAEELTPAEKKQIAPSLTNKFGEHPLVFAVDPLLLTGMIIRYQDQVIDLSGRQNLRQLNQALSS